MPEQVTVVGTGTWGTTLAVLLAKKGLRTALWCRTEEEATHLREAGENSRCLPDVAFPAQLSATSSLADSIGGSGAVLIVVPAQSLRRNAQLMRPFMAPSVPVLIGTKGIEVATGKRMTEVLAEEMPELADRTAVLSGPNLAREIAAGLPATSVVASDNGEVAITFRTLLMTPRFRVYTNSDVVGVELAGALKNIIAIGAGICDGLGLGDNAKAAFISRGLVEMARLGIAAGAQPLTFAGLAGLGDVIATCASRHSRNRYVGEQLALGRSLAEIRQTMTMVAEGVSTTVAARTLAHTYDVEMPIVEMTHAILVDRKDPREALAELMTRDPKDEFTGILA